MTALKQPPGPVSPRFSAPAAPDPAGLLCPRVVGRPAPTPTGAGRVGTPTGAGGPSTPVAPASPLPAPPGYPLAEVFHRAAAEIRTRGWCQGQGRRHGRICAYAALDIAASAIAGIPVGTYGSLSLRGRAADVLNGLASARGRRDLIAFNDAYGTTEQDVLDLFAEASAGAP